MPTFGTGNRAFNNNVSMASPAASGKESFKGIGDVTSLSSNNVPTNQDTYLAREEQIRLEEERLKVFEERVQQELQLKRQELLQREQELREIEERLEKEAQLSNEGLKQEQ